MRIQIIPHPDPDPEVGMKRIQIRESLEKDWTIELDQGYGANAVIVNLSNLENIKSGYPGISGNPGNLKIIENLNPHENLKTQGNRKDRENWKIWKLGKTGNPEKFGNQENREDPDPSSIPISTGCYCRRKTPIFGCTSIRRITLLGMKSGSY